MKKILLLDADFVQTYSVAKSLHNAGYYVIVAAASRCDYGYLSRYPDMKLQSPSSHDEAEYLEFVVKTIREYVVDVVIPLTNNTAEILSRNYESLSALTRLAVMPWHRFIQAHDKGKLMDFCKAHAIAHPRTVKLSLDRLAEDASYIGFPAMLKPNISVGARGIMKVDSYEELHAAAESLGDMCEQYTLQQYIANEQEYYNVMLYRNREGKILAHTSIVIKRFYPIKGGSSSYCETINDEHLYSICKDLLDKLDWVGFADFDVLRDKQEGYKIIEINPRIPASVHAAYISGVNFPEIIVRDLLSLPEKQYNYQAGYALRFLLMDLMWFASSPMRFKANPSWFRFFSRKQYYQDISLSDPMVFVAGVINGLSKLLSSEYRKTKLH